MTRDFGSFSTRSRSVLSLLSLTRPFQLPRPKAWTLETQGFTRPRLKRLPGWSVDCLRGSSFCQRKETMASYWKRRFADFSQSRESFQLEESDSGPRRSPSLLRGVSHSSRPGQAYIL